MTLIKPPRLRKGDLIALVSPASTPLPFEKIEASVHYLEKAGYQVVVGPNAAKVHGYLAGTDEERAADINQFIRDKKVRAIFALRGGYGTPRILDQVDYRALRAHPKIISGFSDITALQLAIFRKCRLVTFSGAMPAVEFWKEPAPFTEENFWRQITSRTRAGFLPVEQGKAVQCLQPGRAEGILLGGNLSLLVSNLGTPYWPSTKGALLVVEEVEEAPYRVDRLFAQLRNSGVLGELSGLACGQFTRCEAKDPQKPTLSIEEILRDYAEDVKGPVLTNFPYGHVPVKWTLPFGVKARLGGKKPGLELLESAVS